MSGPSTPLALAPSRPRGADADGVRTPAAPTGEPHLEAVERELTALVRRVERARMVVVAADGTETSLDKAAYNVLGQLCEEGPMRLSAIAALLRVDLSTVSRQVAALECAGLVDRLADPADRRAQIVGATSTGRARYDDTRALRRTFMRGVLGDWSAADTARLGVLLGHLNASIEGYLATTTGAAR